MEALLEGIRILRYLNLSKIEYEIDSADIIKAAREEGNRANLIYSCRKNELGSLSLRKIKKSQNRIAYSIAQLDWRRKTIITSHGGLPARIRQLIRSELHI
ncbi:hypothetical protein CASFOL_029087 [Castilleja foliolosa]|uniref:RNase H type-1 domain-containing protein n=1 Tax=Castilleja foliolosa TaxID=1961234 RepID=A0ABD3CEK6_9LAMI